MQIEPFHIVLALFVLLSPFFVLRPKYLVFFYLALLFYFPNSGWGIAKGEEVFGLYSKGMGLLHFPLIFVYLCGMFLLSTVMWSNAKSTLALCNIRKYFWAFNAFFFIYVVFGVASGVSPVKALAGNGVVNIFSMSLLVLVLLRAVKTNEDLTQLANLLLVAALTRGIWGIIRFVFLGGDPANVYENIQKINVTVTFFDINDSLIACMAAFYAAWIIMWNGKRISLKQKAFYLFVVAVELFIIIFSYRRTAWGGLVLAAMLFTVLQPWRRRIQVFAIVAVVGAFTFGTVVLWRFSSFSQGGGYVSTLFYDVQASTSEGRFAELYRAFQTVMDYPILGVGPWGGYGMGGAIEFMHSGLLHVWLKTGIIGLVIFIAMFTAYVFFYLTKRRRIPPEHRGLYEAAFAGFLFLLPNLLMGTPIIEYRTMQLTGLVLAIPYLVYALHRKQVIVQPLPVALTPDRLMTAR